LAVSTQRFQAVAWDHRQIPQADGRVKLIQTPLGGPGNGVELPAELAAEDPLGFSAAKRANHHRQYIPCGGKRQTASSPRAIQAQEALAQAGGYGGATGRVTLTPAR